MAVRSRCIPRTLYKVEPAVVQFSGIWGKGKNIRGVPVEDPNGGEKRVLLDPLIEGRPQHHRPSYMWHKFSYGWGKVLLGWVPGVLVVSDLFAVRQPKVYFPLVAYICRATLIALRSTGSALILGSFLQDRGVSNIGKVSDEGGDLLYTVFEDRARCFLRVKTGLKTRVDDFPRKIRKTRSGECPERAL